MSYRIKENAMKEINERFKRKYFIEKLGLSPCAVSNILNRHRTCPKHTAFAIVKAINIHANITDFFEEV